MVLNQINYRIANPADLSAIKSISDLQFGENYLTEGKINSFMNDISSHVSVLKLDQKTIGFSIIHFIKFDQLKEYLDGNFNKDLESLKIHESIQLIKTIALHPDFTSRGLGTEFLKHSLKNISTDKSVILGVNWKRKIKSPMEFLSKKLGLSEFTTLENYWEKDSIQNGYDCPECGKPPCKCSALIFIKNTED